MTLRGHLRRSAAGAYAAIGVVAGHRLRRGRADALRVCEVADDDRGAPQAPLGQVAGEPGQRLLTGLREGLAEHEVLGRVPGEGHLGEDDDVGAVLGGPRRPGGDQRGVAGDVADAGVDLGQGHSELHGFAHVPILVRAPATRPGGELPG